MSELRQYALRMSIYLATVGVTFFAFRLEGGRAIGEGFLDERNDVGIGFVLVPLRTFSRGTGLVK